MTPPGPGMALRTTANHDDEVPRYLVLSIVASVVLTLILNVALRVFPRGGERVEEALDRAIEATKPRHAEPAGSRVRVVFPWRLVLIGSLLLTVLLNLLLWLVS
jgi:hypothetical protein